MLNTTYKNIYYSKHENAPSKNPCKHIVVLSVHPVVFEIGRGQAWSDKQSWKREEESPLSKLCL